MTLWTAVKAARRITALGARLRLRQPQRATNDLRTKDLRRTPKIGPVAKL